MTTDAVDLSIRSGLPEDLRFLLAEIPRPVWHTHPNFGPLTRFYLDRHAMFRELTHLMGRDLEGLLDRQGDPRERMDRFARAAQFFLQELHMHHRVEDHHYFPALLRLEPRLGRGFEILDRDHHAIHEALDRFAAAATAMLTAFAVDRDETSARTMLAETDALAPLLARHLEDEEEIVIPLMLDRGEAALGV